MVRTVVMHEVILRCIENGAQVVFNLGAGLDGTAARRLCWSTGQRISGCSVVQSVT